MIKEPLRIIGINPGSRYLGIAVLLGSELREWRIRVFYGMWSKEKMEKIKKKIQDIIDQYEPNIIVIKKLHRSRRSDNLKYLVDWIKAASRRQNLNIYQYSIKDIKSFFVPEEKTNKQKLVGILSSEFPELTVEKNKEKRNKNPYHIRMFEAVALATRCFYQLDK